MNVGKVLYDGECAFCRGSVRRFGGLLRRAGFGLDTLQNLRPAAPLTEMLVVTPEGRVLGGADGLVEIARRIWWAWPLFALAQVPGVRPLLRAGYRRVAANRYCLNGACRMTGRKLPGAWLPLIILPAVILFLRPALPPWVFMWLLAWAIFAACKWLTFALAIRHGARPSSFRSAAYLFAWVGMDAPAFLRMSAAPDGNATHTPGASAPLSREWLFAWAKTLFGVALIWLGARFAIDLHPLLAGWVGLIGVVFALHFGLFHLLSLLWRRAGVDAPPIMRAPVCARSLAEFWGRRWNTAFHELVYRFTFRPAVRRVGVAPAMLLVFLLSGLIHDLLLSLPAGGGYGWPTIYFLLQGCGVVAGHSRVGRRLGLAHGARGWLFTVLVTAGPAGWLFHPAFIHQVILPMLHAIGAT